MNNEQYLFDVLKQEVDKRGDEILSDSSTLTRILVNYPWLKLPQDAIAALGLAITENFAYILHRNYRWDYETKISIFKFADLHNIDRVIMLYIAEAFAYAIELIEEVEYKTPPKQKKPRKKRLSTNEINNMISVELCDCATLKLLPGLVYESYMFSQFKFQEHLRPTS